MSLELKDPGACCVSGLWLLQPVHRVKVSGSQVLMTCMAPSAISREENLAMYLEYSVTVPS